MCIMGCLWLQRSCDVFREVNSDVFKDVNSDTFKEVNNERRPPSKTPMKTPSQKHTHLKQTPQDCPQTQKM